MKKQKPLAVTVVFEFRNIQKATAVDFRNEQRGHAGYASLLRTGTGLYRYEPRAVFNATERREEANDASDRRR